jgi:hypothetical protein
MLEAPYCTPPKINTKSKQTVAVDICNTTAIQNMATSIRQHCHVCSGCEAAAAAAAAGSSTLISIASEVPHTG